MPLSTALLTAGILLVITVAAGALWRLRDGRRRRASGVVDVARLGLLRDRAALVLFSTETCSRCPQVRRMLHALASERGAVDVHEVDLTHRADLASDNRVLSTPTTLLIGPDARVVARFVGVPRRDDIVAALNELPALQETA
ncbi:thioredoxin family protein [Microbacterium esteraromaticum]|uniref:thioredoxin family protein n=1 Tax=Microbacterium esteraromaticum TaxID=57043 RepID=UPI00195A5EF1|nr:thioredoxin family protein [Microbacterium esteraromaticum]MBM7467309.1 thiol-disulfide isomerase/thioredoxin [Microbacterium esteraromaticum]